MLKGKIAFVTGSTRGIGWASARTLAQNGATVVLNGRASQAALDARVEELRKDFSRESDGLLFDVTDSAGVKNAYQTIFKRFGRLDILVNNAGILEDALIGMIAPDAIERTFKVNAVAVIENLQAAARLMMRNKSGSIVNVSSIIGRVGNAGQVVYGGSKAAVLGITLSAAKELAPSGIRVNAVAPGLIDTDMVKNLPPAKREERLSGVKMGRIGTPQDVANAVLFLACDLSAYVTGQTIGVDGGMLV